MFKNQLLVPWALAYEKVSETISTRERIVEIVSYPYPMGLDSQGLPTFDNGIKCRMVPGYPTTIEELDILNLRPMVKSEKKYRYIHVAEIHVNLGIFPEDMLRYDNAALFDHRQQEDDYRPEIGQSVLVYKLTKSPTPDWTFKRWSSFCCGAKPIETIDLKNQQH